MCKSLGFKKDRKSGHYMREVTPGLEDAIHFFFKPYSGKAVSVSFIVGIYLKELVDLIDELYEKTDGCKSLLWLWCGDLLPEPKVVQWMYYTENGDPKQLSDEIRQFIVDYAKPFLCVITTGKIFRILSLRENMQMRKGHLSRWLCITVVSRIVV